MSSIVPFINKRLTYPGVAGPLFDSDIQNITENLIESLLMLADIPNPGFAILGGLNYTAPGGVDTYSDGYIIYNGQPYYVVGFDSSGISWWLLPTSTYTFSKNHSDSVARNTYQYFACNKTTVDPSNGTPQFVGDMNQYRISLNNKLSSNLTIVTNESPVNPVTFIGGVTGAVVCYAQQNGNVKFNKLRVRLTNITSVVGNYIDCFQLPVGVRPNGDFITIANQASGITSGSKMICRMEVLTGGLCRLIGDVDTVIHPSDIISFNTEYEI